MNGSKDPLWALKVSHILSNLAMIMAAVHSTLGGDKPSGSNCDNDGIGGALATLSPQPVELNQSYSFELSVKEPPFTDHKVDVPPCETGCDEHTANFPLIAVLVTKRSIDIVWPFYSHVLTPDAQDLVVTTCFRDSEPKQILN